MCAWNFMITKSVPFFINMLCIKKNGESFAMKYYKYWQWTMIFKGIFNNNLSSSCSTFLLFLYANLKVENLALRHHVRAIIKSFIFSNNKKRSWDTKRMKTRTKSFVSERIERTWNFYLAIYLQLKLVITQ